MILLNVQDLGSTRGKREKRVKDEYFKNVHRIPKMLGIEQKNFGAYYTDESIVEYVINKIKPNRNACILDPACGCGSFIIPLYLLDNKKKKPPIRLYGVDIDNKAIRFTINLLTEFSKDLTREDIGNYIMLGDFLTSPDTLQSYSESWNTKLSDISKKGGFDIIVGNPPFNIEDISLKKPFFKEQIHRELATKSKNMPIYFILRSLELLKPSGVIAFVLPKTLLYVAKYREFRMYLLHNYKLIRITEIGLKFKGVRGEQIIIFIKNERPKENSEIEFETIKEKDNKKNEVFKIKQRYFVDMPSLPTLPNVSTYNILKKLSNNFSKLGDLKGLEIFRGVPMSDGNADIVPFEISNTKISNAYARGRDIVKLHLRSLVIPKKMVHDEHKLLKIKRPKIIIQNIFSSESGIISYLDTNGLATSETVTNIVIEDLNKLAYVYGLLNSKLLNFYLCSVVFSGSKLTMHLDGYYLKQLPLVWDKSKKEIDAITEIAKSSLQSPIEDTKETLRKLDKYVYELYGIDIEEQKTIDAILSKTLSRKSMW